MWGLHEVLTSLWSPWEAPVPQGRYYWDAGLALRLNPSLIPNSFPPGRRATAARSRTTQNWPASCDPGWVCLLTLGLPKDSSPPGWPSPVPLEVLEEPCGASPASNSGSVPVPCPARGAQSAGSVHYTHRAASPETSTLPAGLWRAGKAGLGWFCLEQLCPPPCLAVIVSVHYTVSVPAPRT